MRAARNTMAGVWVLAGAAAALAAPLEGDGFSVDSGAAPWSRWQTRVDASTRWPALRDSAGSRAGAGLKLRNLSVMGDYYFSRSLAARPGGFRATSGLLVGARPAPLPTAVGADYGLQPSAAALDSRAAGSPAASADLLAESSAVPYVGIGYSGASDRGGFSFSADLGLMAFSPRSAVKLGRGSVGVQNLDDTLRDLRLSPVLQLGVSYSF